jgi:hypothetical protein
VNLNLSKFQTKIKDETIYSLIHTKSILLENVYLIIPLIRHEQEYLVQLLSNIIKFIHCFENENFKEHLKIDEVNLNALFNDESIMKHLFVSFLSVLSKLESENEPKM